MLPKHKIKDEIWKYLNKQFGKDFDILKLTVNEIYEEFKSKEVTEVEIKKALNQLKKEGSIVKKNIGFRISVPSDKIKLLPKQFRRYFVASAIFQLLGGYYLIGIVLLSPLSIEWLNTNIQFDFSQIIYFSMVLSVIAYYVGDYFFKWLDLILKKISSLKNYSDILQPILIILLVCGFIYVPYVIYTKIVDFTHILGILTLSIIGGITYTVGKARFSKPKKD